MASIIDSIKTVAGDSHPFFKMAGFSLIVFLVMQLETLNYVPPVLKTVAQALAIFGLIGFALLSVYNAENETNIVIPNLFNPIKLVWVGILGSVSLFPYAAIVYYGITALMPLLTFEPWVNYIILVLLFAVLSSPFVLGMLLFSKGFNPLAGYNLKYFIKYAGDFIVANLILAFCIVLMLAIIFFPIGLGVKILFDYGLVFNFYVIFSIIFLVMCMMQYYAQLYFEFIALGDA